MPNSVCIAGGWTNWAKEPMVRTSEGFFYRLIFDRDELAGTQLMFKFVVDGEWRCARHYPQKVDRDGEENNCLVFGK